MLILVARETHLHLFHHAIQLGHADSFVSPCFLHNNAGGSKKATGTDSGQALPTLTVCDLSALLHPYFF
jgi:hypothetical protein